MPPIMRKRLLSIFCCLFFGFSFSQSNPSEEAKQLIVQKDLDGDGVLCAMECDGQLLADFAIIDEDQDKFLSEEELTNFFKSNPKSGQ